MKYLGVLLLGLLIGYLLSPNQKATLPPEQLNDFQGLIDHEAKNFALQKDATAKLKAAEELYGKMMILFLANLHLKSTHHYVAPEKPVIVEEKNPKTIAPKEEPLKVEESSSPAEINSATAAVANQKPAKKTDQQIYDEFRSAHYVENFRAKQRRLLGHFTGTLNRAKPKRSEDTIRFEFNLVQEGDRLSGDTLVTLTDAEGKEYSRNAGKGGNRTLKIVPNQRDMYFVDASPTSFFMISFKHFPQITGSYYERGEFIGKIDMRKIQGDM